MLAMVCMGMGITLAADSYAQTQWPGVVFRPLQERVPADLYVVYDEKQATPAVKKLVNTLVGGGRFCRPGERSAFRQCVLG